MFQRYVALGDSFTEGLNDDIGIDGRHRGWADRLADELAVANPQLLYANLAVRGRLMSQVRLEQVPAAVAMNPDLITLAAGVNDALRREFDLDAVRADLRAAVAELTRTGATVVVVAFGDPSRRSMLMGTVAGRLRAYNAATRSIAEEFGAVVMDFWGAAVFDDDELWSADRLHLSPAGHAIACRAALHALGLGDVSWRTPGPSRRPVPMVRRAVGHVTWASGHLAPWMARRLRGVSSGDSVSAKRPVLAPVHLPR